MRYGAPEYDTDDVVGFEHQGSRLTVERPCQLGVRCQTSEADVWVRHLLSWIDVLEGIAHTDERRRRVDEIKQRALPLVEDAVKCDISNCHVVIQPIVSLARLISAIAKEWSGEVMRPQHTGGTGWEHVAPWLPTGQQIKDRALEHFDVRANQLITVLTIGAVLFFLSRSRW